LFAYDADFLSPVRGTTPLGPGSAPHPAALTAGAALAIAAGAERGGAAAEGGGATPDPHPFVL
jgi:hypothetical protein